MGLTVFKLGQLLLNYVIYNKKINKISTIHLGVHKTNYEASSLYKFNNFNIIDENDKLYYMEKI